MKYDITKKVSGKFPEIVEKTKKALTESGFGVLAEINMKEKFQSALNKGYGEYLILGACHSQSAYEAIKSEIEIGPLLSCNVIIYEKDSEFFVSVINPEVAINVTGNEKLSEISKDMSEKLERALELI